MDIIQPFYRWIYILYSCMWKVWCMCMPVFIENINFAVDVENCENCVQIVNCDILKNFITMQ